MKTALILVVLLIVLGGGGYFGWQQMGESPDSADAGPGEEGGAGGYFNDDPKFVELDLLTAPFVRGGKFVQYVVLVINLEVASDDAVNDVRAVMPRLRDAFITELHTIATMRNPEQKMLNMPRIKSRLLASANQVLGGNTVRDVLVQLAQ